MKLNCWLVRNGDGVNYYLNLSSKKPRKLGHETWVVNSIRSFWVAHFCPEEFEKRAKELKLPPGGIMPVRLELRKRAVKRKGKK